MAAIQLDQAAEATVNIQENSGQVAIGKYVVQIGSVHGGVVNIAMPAEQPNWQPRPLPVLLRPRRFAGLLDRQPESQAAAAALQTLEPLEFFGRAGQGKTALLRHLAYQLPTSACPAGIIYLPAQNQPQADLLQFLFEAFFESNIPAKPTDAQIRHGLNQQQALVLLDDVDLSRAEVEALLDYAPQCAFLLASPERRLWGTGQSRPLAGLPPDDALALLVRELDRPLTADEEAVAPTLCALLEGHPLHLLQIAGLVRQQQVSLVEIASKLQQHAPREALAGQLLTGLSTPERRIVGLLATLAGTPLSLEYIAELAGLPDPLPVLEALRQRQIIHSHSPRYSLTAVLVENWPSTWDVSMLTGRVLAYFTRWAERQTSPERLLAQADTLRQLLAGAAAAARWPEALRLARAIEGAFSLSGRWGAWADVLHTALRAADALGDRVAKAWVWHQLGTRALCLDDATAAQTALGRALRLRETLGDRAGAAITRHNLNLLLGPPPPPPQSSPPAPPAPNGPIAATGLPWPLLSVAGLLLAALVALLVWSAGPGASLFSRAKAPPPVAQVGQPHLPAATPVILPSFTPTSTPAFTASPTPSPAPLSPSATPPPSATPTSTATVTPTATPNPTATPSPSATFSPTPTATLSPTPTSTPVPVAWLNPTNLDFGLLRVGDSSRTQTVTLVNTGGGLLSVSSVILEGENADDFLMDAGNCQVYPGLPANGVCTIYVRFRPTAGGNRRANLTVFSNSFDGARSVFLSGAGRADPVISLNPASLNFGEQPLGSASPEQGVTVTNSGQGQLVIGSISLGGGAPKDFAFEQACTNLVLSPGDSCPITLQFSPTAADLRSAELIVAGNAVNSPQRLPLRGVGLLARPDLVFTGFNITDPGRTNSKGEVLLPVSLTVTNRGSAEAGVFKISTEYTGPNGTFAVALTVPGQNSVWYPFTGGPLPAGEQVSFSGYVTFPPQNQGQTVSLVALADSCSGDEFMPPFCRVEESREDNNRSPALDTTLPTEPILR